MSAISLLLAGLGGGITVMVAVGMVLLTPHGLEARVETPIEQPRRQDEPEVGRARVEPELIPDPKAARSA